MSTLTKAVPSRASAKRRENAEDRAIAHFKKYLPGTFKGRRDAIQRIRSAKLPLREAKRLVVHFHKKGIGDPNAHDEGAVDFSDVQELRVKIQRKYNMVDQPQSLLLHRMDKLIAADQLTREEYNRLATMAIKMPCAVPTAHRPGYVAPPPKLMLVDPDDDFDLDN